MLSRILKYVNALLKEEAGVVNPTPESAVAGR
jgi:hypothetical protein